MIGSTVLDRYRIEAFIADGGMGRVYLGKHLRLGSLVAVKVLAAGAAIEQRERMEREAMLAARVRHPNVVQVLDFGELSDGSPCLVMAYEPGTSLDLVLSNQGAMPWQDAVRTMISVLEGLDAIHEAGVLHRDLKPSNVVVGAEGPEETKIIDFGIATVTSDWDDGERYTAPGSVVGTPVYLAPEQLNGGAVSPATDLYAVGLLLVECITGAPARTVTTLDQLLQLASRPVSVVTAPPGLPAVSPAVVSFVRMVSDPDPARRPQSAGECAGILRASLVGRGLEPRRGRMWSAEFEVPEHTPAPFAPPASLPYAPTVEGAAGVVGSESDAWKRPTEQRLIVNEGAGWDGATTAIRPLRQPSPTTGDRPCHLLLIASFEGDVMSHERERVWLDNLALFVGGGFAVDASTWCAYLRMGFGPPPRSACIALRATLEERYGELVSVSAVRVPPSVATRVSRLENGQFPPEIRELAARVDRREHISSE